MNLQFDLSNMLPLIKDFILVLVGAIVGAIFGHSYKDLVDKAQ